MLLMIDNYDSFTYNLVQYFYQLGQEVEVYRNDLISLDDIEKKSPEYVVISPGPCTPKEAGISVELIKEFKDKKPLYADIDNVKLKKIIKLAVILLRIDHCANNATPIIANIEERKMDISEYLTPIKVVVTIKIAIIDIILSVFNTKFFLYSPIFFLLPILLIKAALKVDQTFHIKKAAIIIAMLSILCIS